VSIALPHKWQSQWERVQAAGRKQGKLIINIPASAELRKALEEGQQLYSKGFWAGHKAAGR
jgi:hypothetical protein